MFHHVHLIVLFLFVYEVVVVGQTFRSISSQAGLQLSECFFLFTLALSLVHSTMRQTTESVNDARWLTLRSETFYTGTPASHGIRTQVYSMTCMLHRPERYHLHNRGGFVGPTTN